MGRLRYGTHLQLEAEADRLIKESLAGVTSHSAKSDILTPWKQQDRWNREVYSKNGVPDASVRKGMFHRAWNRDRPDLNSREGLASAGGGRIRDIGGSLDGFAESYDPYDSA